MPVKSLKARSAVSVAALAAIGATGLVAAPSASAAPAATAVLGVELPGWTGHVGFQSLRIDNGTSVTCILPDWNTVTVIGGSWREFFTPDYRVSAGTTYRISGWEGYNCGDDGYASVGGVTVTPTEADLSGPSVNPAGVSTPGVYWVNIP